MALETATYLADLVATNPAATDGLAQADDHLRLIKATLQATFPALDAAVTATPTDLNNLHNGLYTLGSGTSGAPSASFAAEATLGLYRKAAGQMGLVGKLDVSSDLSVGGALSVTGRATGNGFKEVGELVTFSIITVPSIGRGGVGSGWRYLECDGSIWNFSDFPALGALLQNTYGGNGSTTFGVPNLMDTGRFIRSRSITAGIGWGSSQANQNQGHTHIGSGTTSAAGTHSHGGATGTDSPDHTHVGAPSSTTGSYSNDNGTFLDATASGGNLFLGPSVSGSGASTRHTHSIPSDGDHSHTYSFSTSTSGGLETRPEAFAALICVKT